MYVLSGVGRRKVSFATDHSSTKKVDQKKTTKQTKKTQTTHISFLWLCETSWLHEGIAAFRDVLYR